MWVWSDQNWVGWGKTRPWSWRVPDFPMSSWMSFLYELGWSNFPMSKWNANPMRVGLTGGQVGKSVSFLCQVGKSVLYELVDWTFLSSWKVSEFSNSNSQVNAMWVGINQTFLSEVESSWLSWVWFSEVHHSRKVSLHHIRGCSFGSPPDDLGLS